MLKHLMTLLCPPLAHQIEGKFTFDARVYSVPINMLFLRGLAGFEQNLVFFLPLDYFELFQGVDFVTN